MIFTFSQYKMLDGCEHSLQMVELSLSDLTSKSLDESSKCELECTVGLIDAFVDQSECTLKKQISSDLNAMKQLENDLSRVHRGSQYLQKYLQLVACCCSCSCADTATRIKANVDNCEKRVTLVCGLASEAVREINRTIEDIIYVNEGKHTHTRTHTYINKQTNN